MPKTTKKIKEIKGYLLVKKTTGKPRTCLCHPTGEAAYVVYQKAPKENLADNVIPVTIIYEVSPKTKSKKS